MRILAIGLGGCGSRIVDHLYDHDIRSQINCVTPVTIDTDSNSMQQLRVIPKEARMNYRSIDPTIQYDTNSTLDFEEIMRVIQNQGSSEFDAIMLFAGLGGQLTDAMSVLIPELRAAYIEPIFTVCTLPYLHEGRAVASKAIDDLDLIQDISDGVILFDNDTWYRKIKVAMEHHATGEEINDSSKEGQKKGWKDHIPRFPENPRDQFKLLNERIARQIGVLLRAGEFDEAGGMENAEIVLDAGEILNTMTGSGITALGYAIERLPSSPGFSEILEKWRPKTYFTEDAHQKATRVVSLAKRAVYEDISVPCDITSADKALVLIAGPSKELSMKGFQTVRKWIDTSISGLEMRSGDYPVKSSRFVGIIIMLSGIKNIPRVEERRELKKEWENECIEDEKRREVARIQAEADQLLRLSSPDIVAEDPDLTEDDLIDDFEIFIEKIKNSNPVEESPGPIIVAEPVIDADTGKPDTDGWIVPKHSYKTPYQPEQKDYEMNHPYSEKQSNETEASSPQKKDVAEPQQAPEPLTSVDAVPIQQKTDSLLDLLEIEEEILETGSEPIVAPPQPMDTTILFDGTDETEDDLFEPESPAVDESTYQYQESQDYTPQFQEENPFQQNFDSNFKDFRDDILTLSPRDDKDKPISGKKDETDTDIVVPARNERIVASITRMTDIGNNSKPNDSSLGVRTSDRYQKRKNESQTAMVGEKISLSGASFGSRPNDSSLAQGSFTKGGIPKANDQIFSGNSSIRLSSGKAANDSTINGRSIKLGTSPKPNESAINGGSIKLGTSPKTKDENLGGSLAPGGTFPKPRDELRTIGKNTAPKPDDSALLKRSFDVQAPTPKHQEEPSSPKKVRHTPQMPPAPRDDMLERAQERLKIQKNAVRTPSTTDSHTIMAGTKAPANPLPKPTGKPEQSQTLQKKEDLTKKTGEKKTPDASDLFWIN